MIKAVKVAIEAVKVLVYSFLLACTVVGAFTISGILGAIINV